MRSWILFIFLLAQNHKVESENICDFGYCSCKFIGENLTVHCSFGQKALNSNLNLPNKTVILDLSRSNLTYLQLSELLKSDSVEELLLNNNNLNEINGNIFQLLELRRLDLSDNNLKVIKPEVFSEIIKLEYLNLASNKFKKISSLSFHPLVNLKEIILNNNNVGADIENTSLFDHNGCGLTSDIQIISLSQINMGNLAQDYFYLARRLTNLTVSKNNMTRIFTLPFNLFYLDVSENPIKFLKLHDYIGPILRVLKANNLKIEEVLDNSLLGLFVELQLDGNKHLKKFSHYAFSAQILRDDYDFLVKNFSMRHSNISTLDKNLWILFKKIEKLDLQHNPWTCDCRIAWFLKLQIPHYLTENLKCASPPHLNNTRIFDLDPEDFFCPQTDADVSNNYQLEVTAGLVLYLFIVLITLMCIYNFITYKIYGKKNEYSKM